MRHRTLASTLTSVVLCLALASNVAAQDAAAKTLDRTVLPIPEPQHAPIKQLDVRKAKAPPRFEVRAPKGAPNVVIVLLDDMGFGQPSTFGGGIAMPTLDRLASEGLRYNNFHTAALCSPTRAALLTGRTTTRTTPAPSRTSPRPFQATPVCVPTAWRRWPRSCG